MDSDTMLIMSPPDGNNGGTPPDGNGAPPDGNGGGGTPPDGNGGGNSSSSLSWSGATEITSGGTYESPTYTSTSSDQNAVLINTSEAVTLNNITVTKSGGDNAGDNQSFYGTNSAVMVKGGTSTTINGGTVTTSAAGANGVFSYGGNGGQNGADGDGTTVNISNVQITTTGDGSGGIMTTGGGNTVAQNLTIETNGQSSAAIRTDRGGGNVTVTGGSYTSNGLGSPAIYSTAAITVNDATLTSNKSEGVCIEGKNSVTLNNCTLTANNTQTNGNATFLDSIMIYQSMSGDSAEGTSSFTMNGGTLNNQSGHVFHVTNTSAIINLNGVTINNSDSNNVLLSVSDDGWSGASNIATLNASGQSLNGNILVGSNSTLALNLTNGATLNGNISGNVTNASGNSVSTSIGTVNVSLDDASKWYLSGDTYITSFSGDAANVITNGYSLYVNGNILEGTSLEETLPSGLTLSEDGLIITADSSFSGAFNMANYPTVKNFDGSRTTGDIFITGNDEYNVLTSGSGHSTLYGAGNDNVLTGGSARDQYLFSSEGSALVTNFVEGTDENSDVITFYGGELSSVSRENSRVTVTATNGRVMVLQTNTGFGDRVIQYSVDGENIYGAKIGNATDQMFTYNSAVNYYQSSVDNGILYIYDNSGINEVWLDNTAGKYFVGIRDVVAGNSGVNLIGGNELDNLLVGGTGSNLLWGGSGNAADTLVGGGVYTDFWYGYGEGSDVITNATSSDNVYLYNVSLDNFAGVQIDSEKVVATMTNGDVLTINNSSDATPTFQLSNDEKWQYTRSTNTWANA